MDGYTEYLLKCLPRAGVATHHWITPSQTHSVWSWLLLACWTSLWGHRGACQKRRDDLYIQYEVGEVYLSLPQPKRYLPTYLGMYLHTSYRSLPTT